MEFCVFMAVYYIECRQVQLIHRLYVSIEIVVLRLSYNLQVHDSR